MDNHPIPQDVTNFQFRLIGDMTLKQFGYVAGGIILAWVMLASPLFFLLKLFLAGGWVLMAVILAFVPIEGRPSDIMVIHFLKALFSPTQFVYKKNPPTQHATATTTVTPQPIEEAVEKKPGPQQEMVHMDSTVPLATAAIQTHIAQQISPTVPLPTAPPIPKEEGKPVNEEEKLQEEVKELTQALTQAKAQEQSAPTGTILSSQAHEKVTNLEKELEEITRQKQDLERQLVELQKTLATKKQAVFTPGVATAPEETQHVKKIPKQMGVRTGVPLTPDVPNLVTGVIKDSRGNVLGNMLIEVKDRDGNPVRAFKTNQLGQFASATPLVNGTYTISFEDPAGKQSFDSVEITADGQILMPLEIISIDARERLRQELFGKV